ncbi:hypothetical protein FD755_021091, partial [Muntiacus reevesi]
SGVAAPPGAGRSPSESLISSLASAADLCIMTRLLGYVDLSEPHFVAAVLAIVFNPLFWNVEPTASEPGGLVSFSTRPAGSRDT